MNKSQRLRITQKGWNGYSGHFGGIEFKDGISVEIVDPAQAARLGAILSITAVDTNEQAGVAAILVRSHHDGAEVVSELPRGTKPEKVVETKSEPTYSRESLETEADKNGIAGLRAIADKFNVKGRSINELINEIMAAQQVS